MLINAKWMKLLLTSLLFTLAFTSSVTFANEKSDSVKVILPLGYDIFFLPVPQGKISINSIFNITIDNKPISASVTYSSLWPKKASVGPSIRGLNIALEQVPARASYMEVSWQTSSTTILSKSAESIKLNAELIYPDIDWLRESLLLTNSKGVSESWYRHVQELTAIYLADEAKLAKNKYPKTVASQWLYDKPQTFYQLFLSSGKQSIKRQADRFIAFYKSQLTKYGYFKLAKPNDIKYLMGRGLVYHYFLNQSQSSFNALSDMFSASLSWDDEYNGRGFWTERHHAAALNTALSYWEVSGSEKAKERLDDLIATLYKMTFHPINNWPVRNCPQHSFNSHEGWGDSTSACSPWMMALISDQLWRYYLLTSDEKSAHLLMAFAQFMLEEGTYIAKQGKIKGEVIPKYLVSLDNSSQEELDPWSDREHMCDVATMVGKGTYVRWQRGENYLQMNELFKILSEQCKESKLAVIEKYKYVNLTHLTSKPPRKFNWQYSSTDDLPWLMQFLNELESKVTEEKF